LLADGETDTLIELLGKRRAGAAHISDEAIVVCELAGVLEKIGRPDEGLSALLEILAKVPDSAFAHDTARGLAMRLGKADAYLDAVAAAAEKLRRADDASTLADLLLRAADVAEKDLVRNRFKGVSRAEKAGMERRRWPNLDESGEPRRRTLPPRSVSGQTMHGRRADPGLAGPAAGRSAYSNSSVWAVGLRRVMLRK
jgi:hypothetical protein